MKISEQLELFTLKDIDVESLKYNYHIHNALYLDLTAAQAAVIHINMLKEKKIISPLQSDSTDYKILVDAAENIVGIPGLVCEIGMAGGAGTRFILEVLTRFDEERTCIAIDPYGNAPFRGIDKEDDVDTPGSYSNNMMKETLKYMYDYVLKYPQINFLYFSLEDTEFFKRYKDGVPIYTPKGKTIHNKYALVFFDGPHVTKSVMEETVFFNKRVVPNAMFVYDDISWLYDHDQIEKYLFEHGWSLVEKTIFKGSYRKK